jgi:hypothetical protein
VGLAISGTLFSQGFANQVPKSLVTERISPAVLVRIGRFLHGAGNATGVGLAGQLKHLPAQYQPLIPRIISAIDSAFSLAMGQVFWLTFWSALVALGAAFFIREVPLRGTPSVATLTVGPAEPDDLPAERIAEPVAAS